MPPVIVNLAATTELEAVNAMLAACGETPLADGTDLSTATQADVQMFLNILRNITREVQSMGWRFNTEFGYEVAPAAQYNWVDSAGDTTELNIFTPPAGLISFEVTPITEQAGADAVDTEIRPSRKYLVADEPVLVFYDRSGARDGFPSADRDFLYINPVWLFDFEDMPETARRYVTARAARVVIEQAVGSGTLSEFAKRDESIALRNLKREQGENDEYNLLNQSETLAFRGRRPNLVSGVIDLRKNRNSV